jgi:hypothetical protein
MPGRGRGTSTAQTHIASSAFGTSAASNGPLEPGFGDLALCRDDRVSDLMAVSDRLARGMAERDREHFRGFVGRCAAGRAARSIVYHAAGPSLDVQLA